MYVLQCVLIHFYHKTHAKQTRFLHRVWPFLGLQEFPPIPRWIGQPKKTTWTIWGLKPPYIQTQPYIIKVAYRYYVTLYPIICHIMPHYATIITIKLHYMTL